VPDAPLDEGQRLHLVAAARPVQLPELSVSKRYGKGGVFRKRRQGGFAPYP